MKPSRKALAVCLALAIVGEALVAIAHTSQQHVRCAEHGELVHVAIGSRAYHEALDQNEPRSALGHPAAAVQDEHEHCLLTGTMRKRIACGSAEPCGLAASETPVPALVHRAAASGVVIYRIAPKNSPPA